MISDKRRIGLGLTFLQSGTYQTAIMNWVGPKVNMRAYLSGVTQIHDELNITN